MAKRSYGISEILDASGMREVPNPDLISEKISMLEKEVDVAGIIKTPENPEWDYSVSLKRPMTETDIFYLFEGNGFGKLVSSSIIPETRGHSLKVCLYDGSERYTFMVFPFTY